MPKPSSIITTVSGLMNDSEQAEYNNTTCLPMLNLAMAELQEIFELNDIPVTYETSKAITIPAGIDRIGHDTVPAYPSDLIEIRQLWESWSGTNQWTPMDKKDTIPHYLQDNTTISSFLFWVLEGGRTRFVAANMPIDIKFDYLASLFALPIQIKDIDVNLPFTNVETYLSYKTAALCALFIAENENRALALDSLTGTALTRALGIPIKGMQSVITRRKPFRASFKRRGTSY
jgi:hypothetical protein